MAIYRKGGDESGLRTRALQQGIEESTATRNMTSEQKYDRDVKGSGVQGAKNAVDLNPTAKEAEENKSSLGGPVSGQLLQNLRQRNQMLKKTKEKEIEKTMTSIGDLRQTRNLRSKIVIEFMLATAINCNYIFKR